MTLNRERSGYIYFECDAPGGCSNVCETCVKDFDSARTVLKEDGWTTRYENAEWKHYCPDEEDLGWMR